MYRRLDDCAKYLSVAENFYCELFESTFQNFKTIDICNISIISVVVLLLSVQNKRKHSMNSTSYHQLKIKKDPNQIKMKTACSRCLPWWPIVQWDRLFVINYWENFIFVICQIRFGSLIHLILKDVCKDIEVSWLWNEDGSWLWNYFYIFD